MSQKILKKLLAAGCAVSLLVTAPGMTVLADEMQEDEVIVTEADDPEQVARPADVVPKNVIDEYAVSTIEEDIQHEENVPSDRVDMNYSANDEVVGEGNLIVGDGVTATFDKENGAVEFYSDGGTLWSDWTDKAGIDRQGIVSIKVASGIVYLPADSSGYYKKEDWWGYQLFGGLDYLKDFDLSGFNTSYVTDMSYMFAGCDRLTNLDLSSLDTSKVTDMSFMFVACTCLSNLDLSSLDTSNVTNMSGMFHSSNIGNSIDNLDLSNFDTSNVTDMSGMFYGCNFLTKLDVSSFNTSNVTDMSHMFAGCDRLTNLDLSNFDTSNVTDMSWMFASNVIDDNWIHEEYSNLRNLDLSNFDTSNVTNMYAMFYYCICLTNLDLSNFDTSNVTNMSLMFSDCKSLTNLDLSSFDLSKVADYDNLFYDCKSLEILRTPKINKLSDIVLPITMYDTAGKKYTKLPVLGKSIVLGKTQKTAQNFLKKPLSDCTITLKPTSYTYDGTVKKPAVTVKDGTKVLTSGTDYTVAYSKNKNAGKAVVTITATETADYKGTATANFTIKKAAANLTFAKSSIAKTTTDTSFTNALTKATTVEATFTSNNTAVATVDSKSGEVTIKGAGTAIITAQVKAGTNYNAGSATYSLSVTPPPAVSGFSDVQDPNHAFYKAIYWAADAGITKGYPDGTFGIDRSCTRGEMIMFLWRYAGKPAAKAVAKSPFSDVPKTHAFYNAILWGSQEGITKGYPDGTFGINRNVSRSECMMFLWRLRGKPAPKAVSVSPFKDVPKNHAFYNAILWGAQKKITNGYTSGPKKGTFGINENCTRGAIVTFLYRAR